MYVKSWMCSGPCMLKHIVGPKWLLGITDDVARPLSYIVIIKDVRRWHRHSDQSRSPSAMCAQEEISSATSETVDPLVPVIAT